MSKREAKDSTEEPSHQRFLPSAPEEPLEEELASQGSRRFYTYNHESTGFVPYRYVDLLGKLGLHYYNQQKGTNLQFVTVHKCKTWITSIYSKLITLEAINPLDHSSCEFETLVRHAVEHKDCLSAITTLCKLDPQIPDVLDQYGRSQRAWWDKEAVDDFYKGDMPDWMTEDALTGSDKLQYYEMEEENEWLHLYAELALLSKWQSDPEAMVSAMPFEMKKIIVRTREDVESKNKVKAENAIFYISFKTRSGRDCNAIVRKTTDKMPGHFSLEVKCFM